MTRIGVVHMDLEAKGGGEAVAMNALEALQEDYDVTLITLRDPDLRALNDYFNTSVDADALDVDLASATARALNRAVGLRYYVLQNALLGRYAARHADDYALLVSTINELGLGEDAVQYVHFPFDWAVNLDNRGDIFHPTIDDDSLYERLCTRIANVTPDALASHRVFANSAWTASVFEDAYGVEPDVLHPPVDTTGFRDVPWRDREHGFVTVGRIEQSKRIVEIIEIVDGVRDCGHDVHLHVVGPTVDEAYAETVAAMAAERPHVELDGEVPRETLVDTICTHRFGIHGKRFEHFGMAVAELAAGGTVPFVPSDGGQHAIVDDAEHLQFDSPADAVDRIDHVLSNPDLQRDLRWSTTEMKRRFGCERFRHAIRAATAEQLGEPVPDRPKSVVEPATTIAED